MSKCPPVNPVINMLPYSMHHTMIQIVPMKMHDKLSETLSSFLTSTNLK